MKRDWNEQDERLIGTLEGNPAWEILKEWLRYRETVEVEKMIRSRKEESFKEKQGRITSLREVVQYVEGCHARTASAHSNGVSASN